MKLVHRRSIVLAAAASAAIPAVAQQPSATSATRLRLQSTAPEGSMPYQMAARLSRMINELADGRLRVELAHGGSTTGDVALASVNDGKVDAVFGSAGDGFARNAALGLWGATPTFGMDSWLLNAWHHQGGGAALLGKACAAASLNVVSIACLPLPAQPLGWFHKPVTRAQDLDGLKMRVSGLAALMLKELGVQPDGSRDAEIANALAQGKLAGAEGSDLTSDRALHLPRVAAYCMVQSFHEAASMLVLQVNKTRWEALSPTAKALIEQCAQALSEDGYGEYVHRNSADYERALRDGARFIRTPRAVLQAQLNAWDRVIASLSRQNPLFAEVARSQYDFAATAVPWRAAVATDGRNAISYYQRSALS